MLPLGGLIKFSLLDYPGQLAAVVFTQGCPWRCFYCHNPQLVEPQLFEKSLPTGVVLDFLSQRQGKLGGVVISGGEPLMHKGLFVFLQQVKQLGYLVKLDTNGYYPDRLQALLENQLVDYLAMDIKAPLNKYERVVQVALDLDRISQSIELVRDSGLPYEFRTTVPKAFLQPENILSIGQLIKGADKYFLQIMQGQIWPAEAFGSKRSKINQGEDWEIQK